MVHIGGRRGKTHTLGKKAKPFNVIKKWQRICVSFIISCLLASSIKLIMHVVQSPEYDAKPESLSFSLPNETRVVMGDDDNSYTLVVVRCRGNMTWATDVPSDWTVVVHEKCEDLPGTNFTSIFTARRTGAAEECNGYLDYIVDNYNKLSSVTVFMHDDGLSPWSKWKGNQAHTPFLNFKDLAKAVAKYLKRDRGFLHLGVSRYEGQLSTELQNIIWPYLKSPLVPDPPDHFVTKPSAHVAVRREQIRSRNLSTYQDLLYMLRNHEKFVPENSTRGWMDSRDFCCQLELSWHVLFGQPAELPTSALVMDQLQEAGLLGEFAREMEIRRNVG
jgi:hypothetical protein